MKTRYVLAALCVSVMLACTAGAESLLNGINGGDEGPRPPAPAAPRGQGSAGSVFALAGDVTWYYPDTPAERKKAAPYGAVFSGTVFETGRDAWIIIAFREGHGYLYAGPGTKAKVVYTPYKEGSHWVRIELSRGTVRAYCPGLKKLFSCFAVVTPNASAATEGGDLQVRYAGKPDGAGGVTVVGSFKGDAAVTHMLLSGKPLQRKVIGEGESLKIYTGQPVVGPEAISGTAEARRFWTDHGVSVSYAPAVSRSAVRVDREIERVRTGDIRLGPTAFTR